MGWSTATLHIGGAGRPDRARDLSRRGERGAKQPVSTKFDGYVVENRDFRCVSKLRASELEISNRRLYAHVSFVRQCRLFMYGEDREPSKGGGRCLRGSVQKRQHSELRLLRCHDLSCVS